MSSPAVPEKTAGDRTATKRLGSSQIHDGWRASKAGVSTGSLLSDEGADPLSRFFAEFLDWETFVDFRSIGRLFGSLREKGATISGYPLIRPHDCAKITTTLETIFETCRDQFRTRDVEITERFEELIASFHDFCRRIYPSEATAVLLLHGTVLLFMDNAERVIDLVSPLAMRPYAVENNLHHCARLIELLGQAHIRRGTLAQVPISFIAFGAWLVARRRGISSASAAIKMAPFVNLEPAKPVAPLCSRIIRRAATGYLAAKRQRNGVLSKAGHYALARLYLLAMSACYALLARRARRSAPFSLQMTASGPVLVTRAMGGIGDLLMMQPGLEALATARKKSIEFAIPKKFFALFSNDPNVRLVDIDGPVIDVSQYSEFVDLSLCPAGRHESQTRPNVKRGRVELFARAMGVTRTQLKAQGWQINRFTKPEEEEFCERFLAENQLGKRQLIGVQPYSRDSYKDHPGIARIIIELAKEYDVIVFHHIADGLPQGPGLANTAGMPLGDSLALVSRLQAIVSVDSAFLHAAAAYDVPVIALFGPTDPRTFTRHHRKVTILWKPQKFGCVPCWRNEDLPCRVTGMLSTSPCIAAITVDEVLDAVAEAIGPRR